MRDNIRVALCQIDVEPLAAKVNAERIVEFSGAAARHGADLALFPELANLGQVPGFDHEFAVRYVNAAETLSGPFLQTIADAARDLGIHIGVGMAERNGVVSGVIHNTAVLLDPSGGVAGSQQKLHLPGEERHYFAPGSKIEVAHTDLGPISTQICYDLYFPEVARTAALRGAELLCGFANIPHRDDWPDRLVHLASVRAYENMQYVALVNRVGTQHGYTYGGDSVVAAPPGRVLTRAPMHTQATVTATLNGDTLTAERVRRPVFGDRRPSVYDLTIPTSAPPTSSQNATGARHAV